MAHDSNTLLTIIRSSVDFLRRRDLPEERRRGYVDAAPDTVDRAAKLTGQLLAFVRRQALKPEVFELGTSPRPADGTGFDAVFSDVVMPGMGGVALTRVLRERLPHLPVVLASDYSPVLAQEGAHGFELLHKPYSVEQLSRTPRHITRRRPDART